MSINVNGDVFYETHSDVHDETAVSTDVYSNDGQQFDYGEEKECSEDSAGTSSADLQKEHFSDEKVAFIEGTMLLMKCGKYKNKCGVYKRSTPKMVYVEIGGEEKCVRKSSVRAMPTRAGENSDIFYETHGDVHDETAVSTDVYSNDGQQFDYGEEKECSEDSAGTSIADLQKEHFLVEGKLVLITSGIYSGSIGNITRLTEKRVKVFIEKLDKETGFIPKASVVPPGSTKQLKSIDENNEWRLPDHDKGAEKVGGRSITLIRLESNKKEANFLDHWLGSRMVTVKIPLTNDERSLDFDRFLNHNGSSLELVSRKVLKDGEKGGFRIGKKFTFKPKVLSLVYIKVTGPGLESISVKEELEKIADFASLATRKVVSRLELLQSTCHKFPKTGHNSERHAKFFLKSEDFCVIPEKGHVGCGFICHQFLSELLGNDKKARDAICIQVRNFIPVMGIFKGMLMKKIMHSNSPKIELPESMMKVGASVRVGNEENKAMMVVCQGIDPSPHNGYIGRLPSVNKNASPPPTKSFKAQGLGKMIYRLLVGLNVPTTVLDTYNRDCKARVKEIGHSFVRGVADPTNSLPAGHIFLTGVKNEDTLGQEIFITRSPCIKRSDAKMLKVVTSKPVLMSDEQYEFLQSMPFGVVIFAFPSSDGMKSIPESIADGDLDGDRYFVCWKREILEHVQAEPFVEEASSKSSNKEVEEEPTLKAIKTEGEEEKIFDDKDWFQAAQERMTDTSVVEIEELIGKL